MVLPINVYPISMRVRVFEFPTLHRNQVNSKLIEIVLYKINKKQNQILN